MKKNKTTLIKESKENSKDPFIIHYIYRSAKTGRIVTEKWAKKHPATTTKERIK